MFDDLNKNNQPAEGGINKKSVFPKTEDIFADTENQAPLKPDVFKPKEQTPGVIASAEYEESSSLRKKILVSVGIVLILGALGYIGYMGYVNFFLSNKDINNDAREGNLIQENSGKSLVDENKIDTQADIKENVSTEEAQPVQSQPIDSDQDGLSDDEEKSLGMNENSTDTDNDGLFDREEVKVYKTNPLLTDTDGDGFSDGDEVKNGYNPSGSGKLYELK